MRSRTVFADFGVATCNAAHRKPAEARRGLPEALSKAEPFRKPLRALIQPQARCPCLRRAERVRGPPMLTCTAGSVPSALSNGHLTSETSRDRA